MEDIFSNLYLVLQQKLAAITVSATDGTPALRYIAEDTGQLTADAPRALSYPCVLIDLHDTRTSALAENCQAGEVNIVLRLICKPYSKTDTLTPQKFKEKGLGLQALESRIHLALQGWSPSDELVPVQADAAQPEGWPDVFGALARASVNTTKPRPDLRIRELTYTLGFEDYSTHTVRGTAPAIVVVTEEIVDVV